MITCIYSRNYYFFVNVRFDPRRAHISMNPARIQQNRSSSILAFTLLPELGTSIYLCSRGKGNFYWDNYLTMTSLFIVAFLE